MIVKLGASMTQTEGIERQVRKFKSLFGCANIGRNEVGANETRSRGNTILSSIVHYLSFFRNDLERRSLISAGAAAGFASAFGAPVGGLLYSMEEASSFFTHDMLWKTLTATCIATFCISIYYGNLTRYSMLSLEIGATAESLLTQYSEIPLYFCLGTIGGIFGSLFNRANTILNRRRIKYYKNFEHSRFKYTLRKLIESAIISGLTSVLMISSAIHVGVCRDKDDEDAEFRFVHRYNCPAGQINELGSLLFGSREQGIKNVLTAPEGFAPRTLLTVAVLFYCMMIVTFGVAVPTGMFMPQVLVGSSFGGFAGLVIKENYIPKVHPSDFALIGAAAFLAGSQRNVVSLCVILMEGTGQTRNLIPVIITCICARTVGDLLSEGIYEELMSLRGYPFLEHRARPELDVYSAADVMTSPIVKLPMISNAGSIERILKTTPYSAFPVVEEEKECYQGMVRRDQLVAALECKIYVQDTLMGEEDNKVANQLHNDCSLMNRALRIDDGLFRSVQYQIFRSDDVRQQAGSNWLDSSVQPSVWQDQIVLSGDALPKESVPRSVKESKRGVRENVGGNTMISVPTIAKLHGVDVGAIMNKCALSVHKNCPLSRVFDLFTSMGMRHLPVTDSEGKVAGMITRYNLRDTHVAGTLKMKSDRY